MVLRDDAGDEIQAITECSSPDFSLSPPDHNSVTFNATQYALDNFGQEDLAYSSFQIICTFSDREGLPAVDSRANINFTIVLQPGKKVRVFRIMAEILTIMSSFQNGSE